MTGQLSFSRTEETNVAIRIKRDNQSRLTIRTDGKINWSADATNAVLNKNGGDLSINIDDTTFLKFDQSQGDIEVAKTLTLTAPDKQINLPNNSDVGELASNSSRRLYWDQSNVGVDVPLLLHADPTNPLEAAPKQYVDNAIANIFPNYVGVDYSDALNDRIDSALDDFTVPTPTNVIIKDGNTEVTTAFKILGSGRTFIQNSGNELGLYNLKAPTDTHHATRKAYVDDNFVALTGDQSVGGYKTFTSEARFTQSLKVDKSGSASNAVLRRDTIEALIAASGGGDYKITKSGGNYYIEST